MTALQSLTRQEYLRTAGFLEQRAPYLDRTGRAQLAKLTRGIAYICRMRADRMAQTLAAHRAAA